MTEDGDTPLTDAGPPTAECSGWTILEEMHPGVYSVTKSLVGAVSLFWAAERYGEEVFGGRGDGKGSEFVRY